MAGLITRVGRRRRWGFVALAVVVVAAVAIGLTVAIRSTGASAPRSGSAPAAARPVVRISPDPARGINPTTPIVVQAAGGKIQSVVMTNTETGVKVSGALSPDGTTWKSTEPLGYGSSYEIAATATGSDGTPVRQTGTVTTLTPDVQAYPGLFPGPGQTDVGVGQWVVVRFDASVSDRAAAERALQVVSTPNQPGSWYWMSDTEAHYRPQTYWQPGTTVTVNAKLYGVNLGQGVYGQTDRSVTFRVHDGWVAKADGKTEQMQIFQNGRLVKTMAVSLGSPGYPTHNGPHVISDKQPSVIMDSCTFGVCKGQPGYYREKVYLDERISIDGEFVHSAPWSVGEQGNDNVSHGCVNLSPDNAQWFYDHFGIGDVVEITNSGGPPLPLWDTGDWELPWDQWVTGSALSS